MSVSVGLGSSDQQMRLQGIQMLLNEQKQAIIHRAVTHGLHPDVPLKPSGIL